ncbi:MAG: LLM class flavin-dependent oxidoreductase [Acidimicrobiia bacterium]|nr:LLM class flavin-dependent oxidoreductase [Acidimicrobiia bacterium]MDH4364137.1 LLM class flavin-dependent oxidoreductase [Acidimicrobiia bacterium]MDH5288723.1 LLM class flavin-dependent oxidoreductase [Acidimicrobiia bacterium]
MIETARFTDEPAPKMPRLGIALSFQRRPDLGESFDRAYQESLELAAEADRLGIDDIWLAEHHGEEDGYNPSPFVTAGAIAGVTRGVRICFGIALAPLQGHPLRIAEDLAVLDNLSGGRIEPGFGQGYRPEEFAAQGADYGRRTRALRECLDIVDAAWTGERFDYAGEIYRVDGGLLRPTPIDPTRRPPLWLGAAAPRSRARAAARGAGLCIAPLTAIGHTARQLAAYEEAVTAAGQSDYLPHALYREIEVGDSNEEALAAFEPYLNHVYRVQYAPERTGLTYKDPTTGEQRQLTSGDPYYLSRQFIDDRWAIGSVEHCVDLIDGWLDTMRLDRLVFHPKPAGRSLAEAVRAMARVSQVLWPALRARRDPDHDHHGHAH